MGHLEWMILIVALSGLVLVVGSAWAILKWIWSDVPPEKRFVNRPGEGDPGPQ